jgi:hypothetical protein
MPSASVTSERVKPVVELLAVTVTPGTAAFWASSTRPWMLPVVCCAAADVAVRANAQIAIVATIILFITTSLPLIRSCGTS